MSTVHFLHHRPQRYNLGDDLCSPKHYIDIRSRSDDIAIVGGGAFEDAGMHAVKALGIAHSRAILWGVGFSVKNNISPPLTTNLPFALWGLRDRAAVKDDDRFLPCVSCLHPMLDSAPSENGSLLYLNAASKVTSDKELNALSHMAQDLGWYILTNECSPAVFQSHFRACSRMVTNSYHGAYWGLLAGKHVAVLGYSSKFTSLLDGLGVSEQVFYRPYRRHGAKLYQRAISALRRESTLERTILAGMQGDFGGQLKAPQDTLLDFRRRNVQFMDLINKSGLADCSLNEFSTRCS